MLGKPFRVKGRFFKYEWLSRPQRRDNLNISLHAIQAKARMAKGESQRNVQVANKDNCRGTLLDSPVLPSAPGTAVQSEKMVEVQFKADGKVSTVGDQFGIGRVR